MVDLRTVSISGAFNCARARVLWHDGMLKVFDINGLVLKIEADKPVRRKGYVMSWEANTKKGRINMRGKCMTCGGKRWWRVVYMGDEQLWMSA